jgi:hypothetical protein
VRHGQAIQLDKGPWVAASTLSQASTASMPTWTSGSVLSGPMLALRHNSRRAWRLALTRRRRGKRYGAWSMSWLQSIGWEPPSVVCHAKRQLGPSSMHPDQITANDVHVAITRLLRQFENDAVTLLDTDDVAHHQFLRPKCDVRVDNCASPTRVAPSAYQCD